MAWVHDVEVSRRRPHYRMDLSLPAHPIPRRGIAVATQILVGDGSSIRFEAIAHFSASCLQGTRHPRAGLVSSIKALDRVVQLFADHAEADLSSRSDTLGARRSRMSVRNLARSAPTSRTRAARPHASSCRACIPSIQTARTAPAVVEIRACPRACPLDRATCGSRGRWSRCPCPPSRRSRRGRGRPGGPVLGLTDLMPSWPRT